MPASRRVRPDARHAVLRADSHNPEHEPVAIDFAKHIRHSDGIAIGAVIGWLSGRCQ